MSQQELIMKDIQIRDYDKVYVQYMINDLDLISFINKRNSRINIDNKKTGGGKVRKIHISYENNEFIIYEKELKNGYDISIQRYNNIEEVEKCLHVMIDSTIGIAYLQNISYYKDCNVRANLDHPGGGGILLRLCIYFLKDKKERYRITRIQLKDNSMFTCRSNSRKLFFSSMHTLLFGDTWYGKYGFRPYDPDLMEEDKELLKYYMENKEIVQTVKVKDTNLFNYLFEVLKDVPDKSESEIQKFINRYHEKYKDHTISQFFRMFLLDFDSTCSIFSRFYRGFYKNKRLYNFYGHSFYLDI